MKDREVVCGFYVCKGVCSKGRDADFRGYCQTCDKYRPIKGRKPARTDNRKEKLDKINKREMNRGDY